MYNKCIYGFYFFFFLFFFFLHFLIWYTFHKWTSLWLLNTSCTITFFFLFVFNKHNRGDIQLRFKQNKHHPFKPIFSMIFFFFRQMHHFFFHSLKYYTVKKKQCIFFLRSPVTVGGKQQPCFIMLKHISVTICQNTLWSWQNGNTSMPSIPFALHSAYLLQ